MDKKDNNVIERLRNFMKDTGKSANQVVTESDIPQSTLSNLLTDTTHTPGKKTRNKILRYLGEKEKKNGKGVEDKPIAPELIQPKPITPTLLDSDKKEKLKNYLRKKGKTISDLLKEKRISKHDYNMTCKAIFSTILQKKLYDITKLECFYIEEETPVPTSGLSSLDEIMNRLFSLERNGDFLKRLLSNLLTGAHIDFGSEEDIRYTLTSENFTPVDDVPTFAEIRDTIKLVRELRRRLNHFAQLQDNDIRHFVQTRLGPEIDEFYLTLRIFEQEIPGAIVSLIDEQRMNLKDISKKI